MTKDYILTHTPRQIAEENTMEEIEKAFNEISPLKFSDLQRIVFNTGYLAALPPDDKIQSVDDYSDVQGPNGETLTASAMAQTMALYYALDLKRYMEIF